jgi:uncharacterized protein YkwD
MPRIPHLLIAAAAASSVALVLPIQHPAHAAGGGAVRADVHAERALVSAMNVARLRHGRRPLRPLPVLTRPARAHSRDLLLRGVFTHAGTAGSPFWTRVVAAGFPRGRRMAENIAQVPGCGAAAARRTVRMWMASPPHRANLLDRRMRFVGTGAARPAGCSSTILTADLGS